MICIANTIGKEAGPKKRDKHHSYDESVDEAPELIESESVEIEAEVPSDENEPIEDINREEKPLLRSGSVRLTDLLRFRRNVAKRRFLGMDAHQ
jgi:hypothetical protein